MIQHIFVSLFSGDSGRLELELGRVEPAERVAPQEVGGRQHRQTSHRSGTTSARSEWFSFNLVLNCFGLYVISDQ